MSSLNLPPQEFSSTPAADIEVEDCLIRTPAQALAHTVTANRETDARTALKRGIANYLMALPTFIHPTHQRPVRLRKIYDVWPEQEDKIEYPSAVVYSNQPHEYEANGFTPQIDPNCKIDSLTYLVNYAEVTLNLTVDILTSDPEERICFGMLLEDAFNPVDWMSGFQLDLPHYHNLRGVYQQINGNYPDDEPNAFKRDRHLVYNLSGNVSAVRIQKITPLSEVRATITVEDGNEPC